MSMSAKRIFISYSWKQGEWVWDRLVPCLKAGGAKVFIDRERFEAGKALTGQMDAMQDKASRHVLVFSPDYLSSPPCMHEMERAIARDPRFKKQIVIPVLRETCTLPTKIGTPNPLYVDLCKDKQPEQWVNLMDACGADLGIAAPAWLAARDELRLYVRRKQSVNLVVRGRPKWEELMENIASEYDPKGPLPPPATINLEDPLCTSRKGLVTQIVRALGGNIPVPQEPEDLATLGNFVDALSSRTCVALLRFDVVPHRPGYGIDFWTALRHMVTENKLFLLIQSRTPLQDLLPENHPMSSGFTSLRTVELKACL